MIGRVGEGGPIHVIIIVILILIFGNISSIRLIKQL